MVVILSNLIIIWTLYWWTSVCRAGWGRAQQNLDLFLTESIGKRSIFDHGNTTNRQILMRAFQITTHCLHWTTRREDTYGGRIESSSNNINTTISSKTRQGRRCYRLNLERPFNIHCEQSPLEYGDIFAPWSKEVSYIPTPFIHSPPINTILHYTTTLHSSAQEPSPQ